LSCCSAVLQSFCQASCPRIESKSGHTTKRKCTKHRSCNAKDHTDLPKPTLCATSATFFAPCQNLFFLRILTVAAVAVTRPGLYHWRVARYLPIGQIVLPSRFPFFRVSKPLRGQAAYAKRLEDINAKHL
jgi:hypothetical protein